MKMKNKNKIEGVITFKETQQFRQKWFWMLLIFPILLTIGLIILISPETGEDGQAELVISVVVIPVNLIILYCFYITKFETAVTEVGVYYRWYPFIKKYSTISKFDIAEIRIKKSPFLQVGSKTMVWGYGRVHNPGSAKGLHFILKSGKRIFIGSQKIGGFKQAVEKLIPVSTK